MAAWLLDTTPLGTRTHQVIGLEIDAINNLADSGELKSWLEARGQIGSDGSRAAMVQAARIWRGLGVEGDETFVDKGLVFPEARAWIKDKADAERAEEEGENAAAKGSLDQLMPTAFVPTRCCAATFSTTGKLLCCAR
jgi:hypothetical protein